MALSRIQGIPASCGGGPVYAPVASNVGGPTKQKSDKYFTPSSSSLVGFGYSVPKVAWCSASVGTLLHAGPLPHASWPLTLVGAFGQSSQVFWLL